MRIALSVFAGFTLVAPLFVAAQESSFQPRFNSPDRGAREGYCKLRVRVDDVTDVIMFGDRVILRNVRGRPAYDVGSECSSPLPRNGIVDFDYRQTDGPGRASLVDSPDRADGRVAFHVVDPGDGDHKYTLEFRWRAVHHDGWGAWDSDGHGFDRGPAPAPPPPVAFRTDEAMGMCRAAVQDQIWDRYHARDPEFFRVRVDDDRRDWIVGEAVARRHGDRIELRFDEQHPDFRGRRVASARVWERDRR